MILLWIGNLLFLFVVIPAVLVILARVLAPANEIKAYVDDITERGAQFAPHLEALHDLDTTRRLGRQINADLERYAKALERLA